MAPLKGTLSVSKKSKKQRSTSRGKTVTASLALLLSYSVIASPTSNGCLMQTPEAKSYFGLSMGRVLQLID
jgi:hypothetical protein